MYLCQSGVKRSKLKVSLFQTTIILYFFYRSYFIYFYCC